MFGIYLDSASGAPLHPRVLEGFEEALRAEGGLLANPNSLHQPAQRVRRLIRDTEALVLQSVGLAVPRYRVLFTGSGTEAVQTAARSVLFDSGAKGRTWLQSALEHSCNRDLRSEAEARGVRTRTFGLSLRGEPQWGDEGLDADTEGLLSLLSVQNESGITSHILSARAFSRNTQIKLCIDHVAGWGKEDLPFAEVEPEFIAVSGHKIGAFAGIGALIYRQDQKIRPLLVGSQQGGLRGGTENTAGILSLKLALEAKAADPGARERVGALRDRFERELRARFSRARVQGEGAARSPYVSSVTFAGYPKALELVTQLDLMGISVSSGSACQSSVPKPSFVLLHYGLNEIDARNTLRVSLHDHSRWEDLQGLLDALSRIFARVG